VQVPRQHRSERKATGPTRRKRRTGGAVPPRCAGGPRGDRRSPPTTGAGRIRVNDEEEVLQVPQGAADEVRAAALPAPAARKMVGTVLIRRAAGPPFASSAAAQSTLWATPGSTGERTGGKTLPEFDEGRHQKPEGLVHQRRRPRQGSGARHRGQPLRERRVRGCETSLPGVEALPGAQRALRVEQLGDRLKQVTFRITTSRDTPYSRAAGPRTPATSESSPGRRRSATAPRKAVAGRRGRRSSEQPPGGSPLLEAVLPRRSGAPAVLERRRGIRRSGSSRQARR